jgi:hypothetical protein
VQKPHGKGKPVNSQPKESTATCTAAKAAPSNIKITGTTNLGHIAEKQRKEIEAGVTERAQTIAYHQLPLETKPLPEGQFTVANLKAAVAKSALETNSLILNWHVGQAKRIGQRCKVYWDGDLAWYYARIINYDSVHDKHFIYYEVDNTVEWIHLSNETVLVAEDIRLVKYGSQSYPCLTYWASSKAREIIKSLKGYKKGGDYIEYFNEEGLGEYEFVNVKSLSPLNAVSSPQTQETESPTRGKANKRFRACMESAKAEESVVNSVVELVVPEIKRLAFERLQGDKWIGMRVRTSTHRIKDSESDAIPVSAKCVGTIVNYCPNTDRHLVIFDQDLLQPQWIQMNTESNGKRDVELLLAPDEVMEDASEAFHRCQGPVGAHDCGLCGLGTSDQDRLPASQLTALHSCQSCNQHYHSYCYPEVDDTVPSFWRYWCCWKCIRCDLCERNLWEIPMMRWNLSHVTTAIDRQVQICGSCLDNYTNKNNFCPICGLIYSNEHSSSVSQAPPTATATAIGDQSAAAPGDEAVSLSKVEGMLPSDAAAVVSKMLDDQMMVECNECNRWVHAHCDGIDQEQYDAITIGAHPVWGDEYLCPLCRVSLSSQMVNQLQALDVTRTFAEPVTEAIAKNYFDIIRHPMDLLTMARKAKLGHYKSLQTLRQDCELMCLNALVFNKVGDEYWTEAFDYFAHVTRSVFDSNKRATSISAYGIEILSIVDKSKAELKAIREAKEREGKKPRKRREESFAGDIYSGLSNYVDMYGKPIAAPSSRRTRPRLEDVDASDKQTDSSMTAEDSESMFCQPVKTAASMPMTPTGISRSASQESEEDVYEMLSPTSQRDFEGTLTVPTALVPVTTVSYVACAAITLPQEAAYLESFHDVCLVCASADASAWFLYCIDCGEAFHSFCVDTPLATMNEFHRMSWRCANCKICETCGDADEAGGNTLIYCDACDKTHHMRCLSPVMDTMVEGASFYCKSCVICKGSKSTSHAWGYDRDLCNDCDDKAHKASSLANKATIAASTASKMVIPSKPSVPVTTSSSLTAEKALVSTKPAAVSESCGVCQQFLKADSPALLCFKCNRHIHVKCVSNEDSQAYLFLSKPGIVQDWQCSRCLSQLVTQNQGKAFCHLGESSNRKIKLLSKIGLIQRRRINQARMIRYSAISGFDKLMQAQWTGIAEAACLQSIIRWSYRRACQFTSSQLSYSSLLNLRLPTGLMLTKFPNSGPHVIQGDQPALWSRCRAHRYVAMLRLKSAKATAAVASKTESSNNEAMKYLQSLISGPTQTIVVPAKISSLWYQASLASAFLRYTDPHLLEPTTAASAGPTIDPEFQREMLALFNNLQLCNIPQMNPAAVEAKFLGIYKQLLSQPVGMRDIQPLPEKYIDCKALGDPPSTQSFGVDADLLPLPHWAPAGKRPTLLLSAKRSQAVANPASSQASSIQSAEQQKQVLATRLERQSQPDRTPQAIPSIGRVIAMNFTPDDRLDGYFNKKLRQQLDPSSAIYSAYASAVVSLKPYPPAVEKILFDLHNDRLAYEREERERMNIFEHMKQSSTAISRDVAVTSTAAATVVSLEQAPQAPREVDDAAKLDVLSTLASQVSAAHSYNTVTSAALPEDSSVGMLMTENPPLIAQEQSTTGSASELMIPVSAEEQPSKKRKTMAPVLDQSYLIASMDHNHDSDSSSTEAFSVTSVIPMAGWDEVTAASSPLRWFDCRLCCLCKSAADTTTGRLLSYSDGLAAHVNCLRYSDGVYEKSNTLHNAFKAREKAARTRCWYCDDRGASIQCQNSSCKRTFHLACARAANCIFIEARSNEDIPTAPHAIFTFVYCPEHCHTFSSNNKGMPTITYRVDKILEPLRPLFLDSHYTAESEELAEYLSKCQKKNDPASVRTGAIVVHSLGNVLMDQPSFSSKSLVSPYRFRSCRIFWSMRQAWRRASYILEIFKSSDMIHLPSTGGAVCAQDEEQTVVVRNAYDLLEESRSIYALCEEEKDVLKAMGFALPQINAYEDDEVYPIYRIQCFDRSTAESPSLPPIYAGSLEEALAVIISKVVILQRTALPLHVTRKYLSSAPCFGLAPSTFFGLGLPFVRHAIERIPETLALMLLPPTSPRRYYPAYYLPPAEAATRMTLYLQSLKQYMLGKIRKSINGCYRADPRPRHGGASRPRRAMNKSLSKAVGSENDAGTAAAPAMERAPADGGVDPAESYRLENQRLLSMRYQSLASAYLRDPQASLLVRKSSIHGYGLFARKSFEKDDMLVEYIGQKIRQVIADRREVQYEEEGVGSCYLFRQDRDAIVDATRIGGMARFINHCCEPNAYARIIVTKPVINDMLDASNDFEEKHIVIMAARDIAPGEEITYDYKFPVEETKLKCYCGAASCSGVMN